MALGMTASFYITNAYPIPPPVTLEPIIGILSVPYDALPCATIAKPTDSFTGTPSCFSDFYNKWVEASGGRSVVIPFNANHSTLDTMFESLNGILMTGGGLNLWFNQTWMQTAQYLYQKVLAANDAGDFFPLHGTCMSFQVSCLS